MKNKNIMFLAMASALVTPALVAPLNVTAEVVQTASVGDFKDVTKSHPYYKIINEMRDKNIITGYDDGTFKPDAKINRQHAAVLIKRVTSLTPIVPEKAYNDIPSSHMYHDAIKQLQQAGVIKADAKGNFNPTKDLTRGEMALILANAFNLEAMAEHPFKDVSKTSDEGKAIAALYEADITTGYDDGTFKPNESLSRAHYAVFLYRALNYEKNNGKPVEEGPVDIPKLSMGMSLEDFKKVVANDKSLYSVDPNFEAHKAKENSFNDPRHKKLLIEGVEIVKKTNFKYKAVGANIQLEEPNYVSTLPPGFMSTQISLLYNNNTKDIRFNFDFTSEDTVNLSREFFKLAYPELASLDSKINELAKEAREAYAAEKDVHYSEREFTGNVIIEHIGDYKITLGAGQRLEYFRIDLEKE
ncbi:S-layer homology domain-containing protein [Lysinibacillus sp. FSL W8-0992]|uniref:S-layer homology domain-containing protein n=1 Tax=Lysinibacillus sp. FSL W8-0992 TaxID=2954643 RepID=UPI0030FB636C